MNVSLPAIPLLRPQLPTSELIAPYLQRIDQTRIYSNHGPIWAEFRQRLEQWLGGRVGRTDVHVVPVCNGTAAVELALALRTNRDGGLCLMPSFTFIASAHAVRNAGLEPFLLDCDPSTLALTPAIVEAALPRLPARPAAVLVISAFGAPPDIAGWTRFEERHGIPVVFDAAAAMTSLVQVGRQPLAVSFHATKVFGIGEGGAVITTDAEEAARLTAMIGFGFSGAARVSTMAGGNYRVSEYAAAIGLAVLDTINAKLEELLAIGAMYAGGLEGRATVPQHGAGREWAAMTFNLIVPANLVDDTTARLDAARIQWRRWWGLGTHTHPAFADCAHLELTDTDAVAPRVIGVPMFEGLDHSAIKRVVQECP
jgi:dTDP-4-amino-4,6-dideoxygalactose transaminase